MSTLVEIESAAERLPPEQKRELIRFLAARLRPANATQAKARLLEGPNGTLLLEAPAGAPPMNTETVRRILEDFP